MFGPRGTRSISIACGKLYGENHCYTAEGPISHTLVTLLTLIGPARRRPWG